MKIDLEVQKALYNKDIDSLIHNPNIVINENNKSIKEKILTLLKKSKKVDIAVSYVVWSGLSLIYEELTKFGPDSRFLLTTEGMVTDLRSLKELNKLNMQIKVYNGNNNGKGFHLKTYMFQESNTTTLLIGSSNISARAFGLVHEMAVEIKASHEGYIVEEYKKTFNELWEDSFSIKLSEDYIQNYLEIYKEKIKINKSWQHILLNTTNIKPNYMQTKALEALKECRKISDKGLVIAATGTGKTYLSAFDVKNSEAKKILFLVHNRLILNSAIKTYQKIFVDKKILELNSSNTEEINNSDILFTTDKTAFLHLINKVPSTHFDYIVYDEAHKIGLDTKYSQLIEYFKPKFSLGITATPERTDNPDYLFKTFKYSVPYEIRLLDAMNHELVCPFTYYGLNLDSKLLNENEEFNYVELSKYIQTIINKKGHFGEKLKCLVFCSNIKEANDLSKQLNKIGYKSVAAVSGENSAKRYEVEKYIENLQSNVTGTLEIICTVNKFNEGIDIPDVNTIIMLRNTTSAIVYLQQLGRGLRRTEDPHKYVTVFDIIGNSKNNYTIAQVLSGNTTVDVRKLYMHANKEFGNISPFINVELEKIAMEKIIKSISTNFLIKPKLKEKFTSELYRFKEIPTLLEMYLNPNFNEIELLQLIFKNFYEPFEEYYYKKYNITKDSKLLVKFFNLITQFVFRSYSKKELEDYVSLLKGNSVKNEILRKILIPQDFSDGISTAINSDYNKKGNNFIKPFIYKNQKILLNPIIYQNLKENNALNLFYEHIELFEYLSNNKVNIMKPFDLVDKGEFLFNVGSKDCYMNVVGERVNNDKKEVYCMVNVTEKTKSEYYENYIDDLGRVVYCSQVSKTKEDAYKKVNNWIKENYKFNICAKFPHLKYPSTIYFNLGPVTLEKIEPHEHKEKNKYYYKMFFKLENKWPQELLLYKEEK